MFNFKKSKEENEYELKLLKKQFDIDETNHIANIDLKYDKASDLLDNSVGKENVLNNEVYEKITSIMDTIPANYRCNFNIILNDFEGYDSSYLTEIFEGHFAAIYFQTKRSLKRKRISSLLLLISGLVFLILAISSLSFKWFSSETIRTIVNETLDIVAWVFIWEAATIYYIDSFALKAKRKIIQKRINSIRIISKNDNRETSISNKELFSEEDKSIIDLVKEKKEKEEE